jgi:DNA-binding transcriptional regulator GbsR (MarR family)
MYFQITVKVVSVNDRNSGDADSDAEIMEFVEQLGGYFESNGLTRLAGRLLGWLLVCEPERQSSEELAAALNASSGGVSTNARMLIQFGFVERLGVAGDRRTYFRLRPHAFAAGERQRIRTMADLQTLADVGLHALRNSPPERSRRIEEMRELTAYMGALLTDGLNQFSQQSKAENT